MSGRDNTDMSGVDMDPVIAPVPRRVVNRRRVAPEPVPVLVESADFRRVIYHVVLGSYLQVSTAFVTSLTSLGFEVSSEVTPMNERYDEVTEQMTVTQWRQTDSNQATVYTNVVPFATIEGSNNASMSSQRIQKDQTKERESVVRYKDDYVTFTVRHTPVEDTPNVEYTVRIGVKSNADENLLVLSVTYVEVSVYGSYVDWVNKKGVVFSIADMMTLSTVFARMIGAADSLVDVTNADLLIPPTQVLMTAEDVIDWTNPQAICPNIDGPEGLLMLESGVLSVVRYDVANPAGALRLATTKSEASVYIRCRLIEDPGVGGMRLARRFFVYDMLELYAATSLTERVRSIHKVLREICTVKTRHDEYVVYALGDLRFYACRYKVMHANRLAEYLEYKEDLSRMQELGFDLPVNGEMLMSTSILPVYRMNPRRVIVSLGLFEKDLCVLSDGLDSLTSITAESISSVPTHLFGTVGQFELTFDVSTPKHTYLGLGRKPDTMQVYRKKLQISYLEPTLLFGDSIRHTLNVMRTGYTNYVGTALDNDKITYVVDVSDMYRMSILRRRGRTVIAIRTSEEPELDASLKRENDYFPRPDTREEWFDTIYAMHGETNNSAAALVMINTFRFITLPSYSMGATRGAQVARFLERVLRVYGRIIIIDLDADQVDLEIGETWQLGNLTIRVLARPTGGGGSSDMRDDDETESVVSSSSVMSARQERNKSRIVEVSQDTGLLDPEGYPVILTTRIFGLKTVARSLERLPDNSRFGSITLSNPVSMSSLVNGIEYRALSPKEKKLIQWTSCLTLNVRTGSQDIL